MRPAFLIATCAVVAGCAPMPVPPHPPAPAQAVIAVPFDSAWQRIIGFFADSRVPIQTIDKASGLIASTQFHLAESQVTSWVDCGIMPDGQSAIARLQAIHNAPVVVADFNVFLQPMRDSSTMRVNLGVNATARAPGGIVDVRCVSSGAFEKMLFLRVSGAAR